MQPPLYPVDAPCTTCGLPHESHARPIMNAARQEGYCLEYRQAPGDTVLACVLELVALAGYETQLGAFWSERLHDFHIPLEVPWVRWTHEITLLLQSHQIDVTWEGEGGVPTARRIEEHASNGVIRQTT